MKKRTACECDSRWTCRQCRVHGCMECTPEIERKTINGEPYCGDCTDKIIKSRRSEIDELVARLKLTGDVQEYDPKSRGSRAHHRHRKTNYEELIADLDRDDALDRAKYLAIHARLEELLGDGVE